MKTFIQIFCIISLKISGRATALMNEPPCPNITLMCPVHVFPSYFSKAHFYILPLLPRSSKKSFSFRCPINTLYPHTFSLPYIPHAQLISFTLISWLWYLVRNMQDVCIHYAVFSILLSLPPSQTQISFLAHYSWNIFSLCSPFKVWDQVTILYKTRQNYSAIHFTHCRFSIK